MTIHKVLTVLTRNVLATTPGGYTYNDQHTAYSDYQYFSSLQRAKDFCQRYFRQRLVWEGIGDDCCVATVDEISFNIYSEEGSWFNTEALPALPTDPKPRHRIGD